MEENVMFFQPMIPVIIIGALAAIVCVFMLFKTKGKHSRFHWGLRAFAALLILTAGFRPSTQTLSMSEEYNNRYNVYFVVDLTSSIVAEDWDGQNTRLEGIREDINDLLDDYVGAKFSLITFNSTATMRVPLTPDSTALASSINTMLPEVTQYSNGSTISAPKTLLENTLKAEKELDPEGERASIVLYFGDGEQTSAMQPESFSSIKELVSAAKVYGYGTTEGGKMKTQTGYYISSDKDTYIKDLSGKEGLSIIDENNLKVIAQDIGGEYEHRDASSQVKAAMLDDSQKVEFEKKEGANVNNTVEYYWAFFIPFLLIMFVEAGSLGRKAKKLGVRFK
jgi:Ca-activated chloride channel family protein